MAPPKLLSFLTYLEEANKLTHFNVSWNSLDVVLRRIGEKRRIKSMDGKQATRLLCSFVKRQTRLQHLDLSNTHLSERSVHYLIKRIAKSTSLNSVHLSGVVAKMSEKTMAFLMEKLDPVDRRQKRDLKGMLEAVPTEAPPIPEEKLAELKEMQNVSGEKQAVAAFDKVVAKLND